MTEFPITLRIARVRDQARLTRSFDLFPVDGPQRVNFIPGQVAILGVTGEDPAYFAFASAPEDRELEVLVEGPSPKNPQMLQGFSREFKMVHFKGIADKDFVPGAKYYIEFFSLRAEGDAHGSAYRGWGLGSF